MTVHRRAVALATLALVAAPALAETVAFDNSDLTFTMVPSMLYSPIAPPFGTHQLFNPNQLFVMSSPAANAAGSGAGPSFAYNAGRNNVSTSSYWQFDLLASSTISKALLPGFISPGGNSTFSYQPIRTYSEGAEVASSDFAPPEFWAVYFGPIAAVQGPGGLTNAQQFIGDEAILGFRIPVGPDYRYGFVRMTWVEDLMFDPADGLADGLPTDFPVNMYQPTAWGYETELNTPVLIQIPAPGAALIPSLGALALTRRRRP